MRKQTSDAKHSLFGKANQATLRYSRDICSLFPNDTFQVTRVKGINRLEINLIVTWREWEEKDERGVAISSDFLLTL
jgi:hypothetical protein